MRIAVLSFKNGIVCRGVETMVNELGKRWGKDHKVMVFQMGQKYAEQKNYQVEVVRMKIDWQRLEKGSWWRKFMIDYWAKIMMRFTKKCLRKIDKEKVDVIIAMNGGWQVLLVRLYCWRKRIKMVVSGQAGLGFCDGWNLLMRPDVFVALSKRNAVWAKRFYGKGVRIEVITNGVDLKRFRFEGEKIKLKLKRPVVLCAASGDRYKRVEEVIKAMTEVEETSLLLAGGSDEQEELGKRLLGKRFLRKQFKHEQMPMVYRVADAFVLVSESTEAFGNVYVEALASGLPVVGTDDQLRRGILGKYGIYVKDATNIDELVDKLRRALKQKKMRPKNWLEKFDWDIIAEEYEQLFQNIVKL